MNMIPRTICGIGLLAVALPLTCLPATAQPFTPDREAPIVRLVTKNGDITVRCAE